MSIRVNSVRLAPEMGRPRSNRDPGALTEREQEVLALLRDGLTNAQIAERLGISLETARHHVSEILSKLDVSSRDEAAAASVERRPGWLLLMRWALVAGAAALVVGIVVLAVGVLGDDKQDEQLPDTVDSTVSPGELAVRGAYADFAAAIDRPGFVFHTTITTLDVPEPSGSDELFLILDIWVDYENGVARREQSQKGTAIVVDGAFTYPLEGGGESQTPVPICPGTADDALISLIVDCHRVGPYEEPFEYHFAAGAEYEGRDATLIDVQSVCERRTPFPEEPAAPSGLADNCNVYNALYVNPATYLPIAKEAGQNSSAPDSERHRLVSSYENEFVDRSSLPADFFDPASLPPTNPSPTAR